MALVDAVQARAEATRKGTLFSGKNEKEKPKRKILCTRTWSLAHHAGLKDPFFH
jgi:hypothetical protein